MKTIFKTGILALSLILAISSCKKEEETPVEKDLTTSIVGSYNGSINYIDSDTTFNENSSVTITKLSNKSVNIAYNVPTLDGSLNIIANVIEASGGLYFDIPKTNYTIGTTSGYYEGILDTQNNHNGSFITSTKQLDFGFKMVSGSETGNFTFSGIKQ